MNIENIHFLEDSAWDCLEIQFHGLFLRSDELQTEQGTDYKSKWKEIFEFLKTQPLVREVQYLDEPKNDEDVLSMGTFGVSEAPINLTPIIMVLNSPVIRIEGAKEIIDPEAARCFVIISGALALYGVPSQLRDYQLEFSDARDKLLSLLTHRFPFTFVEAHGGGGAVFLLNGGRNTEVTKRKFAIACSLGQTLAIRDAMSWILKAIGTSLTHLYLECDFADKSQSLSDKVLSSRDELLGLVSKFIQARFYDVPKRHDLSKQIRLSITSIYDMLTKHSMIAKRVEANRQEFEKILAEGPISLPLSQVGNWAANLTPGEIDREETYAIIDHARGEITASATVSVTIWAAVVGAIVAFVLSLLISHG